MTRERRQAERHPFELRIEFASGAGLTRDVSGLGIYFDTATRFEKDDEIDFTIMIPEAVHVRCSGTVRHVEERDGTFGVGVSITQYRLADPDDVETGDSPHLVIRELRRYQS